MAEDQGQKISYVCQFRISLTNQAKPANFCGIVQENASITHTNYKVRPIRLYTFIFAVKLQPTYGKRQPLPVSMQQP